MAQTSLKKPLSKTDNANTPMTFKVGKTYASIHEAALTDFPEMTFQNTGGCGFKSELAPWPDGIKAKIEGGSFNTDLFLIWYAVIRRTAIYVDDFERALKNMETATDVAAVKEGVELIYNKFMSVLGQDGVKVIETKEKPLDTDFHEAIAVIPAPDKSLKGKILDCVQTGYTLNDKVIRHAKVVVGE